MSKLNLVILGGGNGPHCYAGIAASRPDVEVRVLTVSKEKADKWTAAASEGPLEITFPRWKDEETRVFSGEPKVVTNDPKEVIPGANLIVFMVPGFMHQHYFTAIEPYLEEGMVICGIPAVCGFLFQALSALGDKAKKCTLLAFPSLPWTCRMTKLGREGIIFAGKNFMTGASIGDTSRKIAIGKTAIEALDYTLYNRPKLNLKGHILGDALMYVNAFIHPSIEYGTWKNWDGKPLDQPPDFYHGANELAAELTHESSNEALKIRDAIKKAKPDIDLSLVEHMYDWYLATFPASELVDKTNLFTIYTTHKGYTGIKHPMVKTDDGKYIPDYNCRFYTEDIPCGLVVMRGIADIVGVETPRMDKMIYWAQNKMGKEYLVDGKLTGKDIGESRCPQVFGITTLDGLLG